MNKMGINYCPNFGEHLKFLRTMFREILFGFIVFLLLCAKGYSGIKISFDSSYPEVSRSIVLKYHEKITKILNELTGKNPSSELLLVYDPSSHRGFKDGYSKLIDPYLPGGIKDWFWWYLVEISHFYVPDIDICKNNPEFCEKYKKYFNPYMAIREHEYISHALTEYVIVKFLSDSDEFKGEIELYKNQERAWLNPIRYVALREISPQTIFQIDTNYNSFNPLACDVVGSMFFKLEVVSPGFFRRLFSKLANTRVMTIEDYIKVVADSVNVDEIDGINKLKWLREHPYFARFRDENLREYSLDIFTLSTFKESTYPWHRITYVNPQYFIVTGSSNRYYEPGSYTATKLDPDFFGKDVDFCVKNQEGEVIYRGKTIISDNLWSNSVYLPDLDPGKYYIEVYFKTATGELLRDIVYFYVTGDKNLYDEVNRFLVINGLAYGNGLFDVVLHFDGTGWFTILYVGESIGIAENGHVQSLDSIILNDVMVGYSFYDVEMGYINGRLYFKKLLQ